MKKSLNLDLNKKEMKTSGITPDLILGIEELRSMNVQNLQLSINLGSQQLSRMANIPFEKLIDPLAIWVDGAAKVINNNVLHIYFN